MLTSFHCFPNIFYATCSPEMWCYIKIISQYSLVGFLYPLTRRNSSSPCEEKFNDYNPWKLIKTEPLFTKFQQRLQLNYTFAFNKQMCHYREVRVEFLQIWKQTEKQIAVMFILMGGKVSKWIMYWTPHRPIRGHCIVLFSKTLHSAPGPPSTHVDKWVSGLRVTL